MAITPRAMQQRMLGFRRIGVADVVGGVIGAVAGITAALLGAGIWSMAVQVLVTDTVIAVMPDRSSPVDRRPNLALGELRSILPFSLRVFGSNAWPSSPATSTTSWSAGSSEWPRFRCIQWLIACWSSRCR